MRLQLNVPNDSENSSKWMTFRKSGAVAYATLFEGALYEGDTDFELNTEDAASGEYDPVVYYAKIDGQKEAPSVGIELKAGCSLDHEALSAVLGKLDRVAELLDQLPENYTEYGRRKDVNNALRIIESIKTDILE